MDKQLIKGAMFLMTLMLAACGGAKKEEVAEIKVEAKPEVDRGVTIQEQSEPDTLKGSLKAFADAEIGGAKVVLNYYSPAVRGRVIWGGLVPYDQMWVTGAHKATNVEFDRDVKFGDTIVEAGRYALFTIPGTEQWTVVINKNWDQHLVDEYDQKDDVVRLKADPTVGGQHQERLRYEILSDGASNGHIEIHWEKVMIRIPFEFI